MLFSSSLSSFKIAYAISVSLIRSIICDIFNQFFSILGDIESLRFFLQSSIVIQPMKSNVPADVHFTDFADGKNHS